MLDLETQLQGPEFRVLSPRSRVPVQKIVEVITECEENLLKVVTAITKCDRKVLQSMEGITRWYSKLLQSVKITEQKMKFSIKDFFSKMWPNPQFQADLVTFIGEILHGRLHFLRSESGN